MGGGGSTFEPLLPASAPTGVLLIIRRLLTRGSSLGLLTVSFALVFACVRLKQVSRVTLLATSLFVGCQRQMVILSGASEVLSEVVCLAFREVCVWLL